MEHYRRTHPSAHHELKLARLEALIDAIFGFAMTLLVLNLVIPRANLAPAELSTTLRAQAADILVYVLSFFILGNFWTFLNWQSTHLRTSDTIHVWLTIALLMFVALVPYATFLLAEYASTSLAEVFFAADVMLIALFLYASWFYATEGHRLVPAELDRMTIMRGRSRSLIIAGVGAVVLLASFFVPRWGIYIYLVIPVLLLTPLYTRR